MVWDPPQENMEDLMSSLDLMDVSPSKFQYTWNNKRVEPGHIAIRLDHFLINVSFLSLPNSFSSSIIPWSSSDHCPISLCFVKEENLGPISFRFNPLWMEKSDFPPLFHVLGANESLVPQCILGNINLNYPKLN
jgi:hypothetical protein